MATKKVKPATKNIPGYFMTQDFKIPKKFQKFHDLWERCKLHDFSENSAKQILKSCWHGLVMFDGLCQWQAEQKNIKIFQNQIPLEV